MGKIRNPQYRIVVADSRTKRDGRAIEEIGLYHPKEEPSRIEVNSERVQHWLRVGAQPSEPVRAILSKTGDWQRFKGLPAPTEPLKVAPARADRTAIYEAEAKAAAGIADGGTKASAGKADASAKASAGKADAGAKASAGKADAGAKASAGKADAGTKASAGKADASAKVDEVSAGKADESATASAVKPEASPAEAEPATQSAATSEPEATEEPAGAGADATA
jgi:small subunit ribosomal protein S16